MSYFKEATICFNSFNLQYNKKTMCDNTSSFQTIYFYLFNGDIKVFPY